MTTSAKISSKSPTIRRILREAQELSSAPSPDYAATPLDSDLFEWHFTFRGPPNSVYSEGIYHGRIVLPPTYPLRPPSFRFLNPSGRFEANREICLSISGHHEETWQPAWGVRTALVALRSFMETDPKGQLGGLETSEAVRRRLALESHSYKCSVCGKTNLEILEDCEEAARASASALKEVEIPPDLKMGWKEDMQAPPTPAGLQDDMPRQKSPREDEGAELAEGFIRTGPPSAEGGVLPETLPIAGFTRQDAGPQSSARSMASPSQVSSRQPEALQVQGPTEGIVPWVDRGIVVLVVLLAAMLVKVLVGP